MYEFSKKNVCKRTRIKYKNYKNFYFAAWITDKIVADRVWFTTFQLQRKKFQ